MDMSAHQAIRLHWPLRFGASLAQRGQELLAVFVVPEDILTLIPTVHDVIHGPRILHAQLARHGQPLAASPGSVKSEDFQGPFQSIDCSTCLQSGLA
jgi:hypothetical protein